jgi:hypothetical protein
LNFKPWVLILLIALKALAKFLLGEKGESKNIGTCAMLFGIILTEKRLMAKFWNI